MVWRHPFQGKLTATNVEKGERAFRTAGFDAEPKGLSIEGIRRSKIAGIDPDSVQTEPNRTMMMRMVVVMIVIVGLIVGHGCAMTDGHG